jgi:hypothetical protein
MVNRLLLFLNRFVNNVDGSNMFMNMLYFGVSLQLGCFILWAFNIFPAMGVAYPFGSVNALSSINSAFVISPWTAVIGGTGLAIGILTLLFRAGTYAIYAVLVFAAGVFFSYTYPFFIAIPNTIAALLPPTTNPFAYVNGVYDSSHTTLDNPLYAVVLVIFTVALFIFVFEMFLQRKVS